MRADPLLAGGYTGIGYSQGGLLLRGLAQLCPEPPMLQLVTIGSPHQGIAGLPRCPGHAPHMSHPPNTRFLPRLCHCSLLLDEASSLCWSISSLGSRSLGDLSGLFEFNAQHKACLLQHNTGMTPLTLLPTSQKVIFLIIKEGVKKASQPFSPLPPTGQQCQTCEICICEGRGGKTEALCDDHVEK